jgi:CrcB protein
MPDPTERHVPAQRRDAPGTVLTAVAAGGVLGSLARAGLTSAFPSNPGGFGWLTFGINVTGCLLIGVLMVMVEEIWTSHRLLRPFLGAGVLGGFTTFSAYVHDANRAIGAGAARTALVYLAGTLIAALAAAWAGATVTRQVIRHLGREPAR